MKQILGILLLAGLLSPSFNTEEDNYPIPPKTRELMFYIQRNHNANTIIYEANFNSEGILIDFEPIVTSWIRYDDEGQRKELSYIQRWYAYGIKCRMEKDIKNSFIVELVAHKEKRLWLKQISPYEAKVYTFINNQYSELDHLFIQADNSGVWPKVKYIELFGTDPLTGESTYERYLNPQ